MDARVNIVDAKKKEEDFEAYRHFGPFVKQDLEMIQTF